MDGQADFWKHMGGEWADNYWNLPNTRGKQLVDYFGDKQVTSFLEIGCNSGRNLAYLCKKMPSVKLVGLELSPAAAADARKNIPTASILEGDLHKYIFGETYDVVFTGGVLMHIEPKAVPGVIRKFVSLANKYVVHMEPIGKDIVTGGPKQFNPRKVGNKLRCLHDIEKYYRELGFSVINKKDYFGSKEAFIVLEK